MASFEDPRKVGTAVEFDIAYGEWRRLQRLNDEAIDLPPGPEAEARQDSAFEACERAERILLEMTPRYDSEAVALIEVLLGNEEVVLGAPVLRRIQTYLSSPGRFWAGRRMSAQGDRSQPHRSRGHARRSTDRATHW